MWMSLFQPAKTLLAKMVPYYEFVYEPQGDPGTMPPTIRSSRELWDSAIDDTVTHETQMIRVVGGTRIILMVENKHDQIVTVQLRGNIEDDPAHAGNIGASGTIAANTTEPVTIDGALWACFMGLQISYAAQPTAGEGIRVTARTEGYR